MSLLLSAAWSGCPQAAMNLLLVANASLCISKKKDNSFIYETLESQPRWLAMIDKSYHQSYEQVHEWAHDRASLQ